MTWIELRTKCKRQSDYIITLFITNELSLLLTWCLHNTRVTPNHLTIISLICGLVCGISYAFGFFITGSFFLFLYHLLDCADGNLARAKDMFSPMGKYLDQVCDRAGGVLIFLGIFFYYFRIQDSPYWLILSMLDGYLFLYYYYVGDMSLQSGVLSSTHNHSKLTFYGVRVKWGVLEPVLYGLMIFAPLGLLEFQLIFIFILTVSGIILQSYKIFFTHKNQ